MRKSLVRFGFIVLLAWTSQSEIPAQAQQPSIPSSTAEDSLKKFLQDYARGKGLHDDKTVRYFRAFLDLNGDGKNEAIVYLEGRWWCGSGGCPTLILSPEASSYRLVAKIIITRPPIRVLTTTSNGWHNLSVRVEGGGVHPGYEAELSFNGKTYPTNPSMPPARPLAANVAGEVVIGSSQVGTRLYP
jgi:hypothetical protein